MEVDEAIARAVATSGSAICFAGGTVVVALVTFLIAGIPLVTTLGYTSAFAVITAVLAALTLLPAILSHPRRPHRVRAPSDVHASEAEGAGTRLLGRLVAIRHWASLGGDGVLGPDPRAADHPAGVASVRPGGHRRDAEVDEERQAYDLMTRGFGPGYNGPFLVAVSVRPKAKTSNTFFTKKKQAESLQTQLKSEQKSGNQQKKQLETGQQSVEQQQASLEKQQKQLQAEQKQLESDGAQLQAEQKQLVAEKNSITRSRTS